MTVPNRYKVPKKVWNRWTERGQLVFNTVFSTMRRSQFLFLHPQGTKNRKEHWRTTCWNAAWTAADAASAGKPTKAAARIAKLLPPGQFYAREIVLDVARSAWVEGYAACLDRVV